MTADEQRNNAERARRGSIIESIVVSLERFNGNLSDERKVRLFSMETTDLKKLATDIGSTKSGQSAISLIVASIAASQQEQRRG